MLVSAFQPLERKLAGLFGLKSWARELLAAQSARTFLSGELALDPHPLCWQLKSPALRQGWSHYGINVAVSCEDGRLGDVHHFGAIDVSAQPLDLQKIMKLVDQAITVPVVDKRG